MELVGKRTAYRAVNSFNLLRDGGLIADVAADASELFRYMESMKLNFEHSFTSVPRIRASRARISKKHSSTSTICWKMGDRPLQNQFQHHAGILRFSKEWAGHNFTLRCDQPWCILRIKRSENQRWIVSKKDVGIINYQIDNKPWRQQDQFTRWSQHLHLPWMLILADELEDSEHTLILRTTADKNNKSRGTSCRIFKFCVNGVSP